MIETYWLKQEFLIGPEITIADLSAACELAQLRTLYEIVPEIKALAEKHPKT